MSINPEKIEGNIATTPTGAKIDLTTGQLISGPPASAPINPTNNSTITGNQLTPTPSLSVQPNPSVPIPNVANIPITTSAPTISAPPNDFIKQLEGLTSKLEGRQTATAVAESEATRPFQEQLKSINAQIAMHQANALAAQEKALQSGETLSFASGEAQRVARNDAIETLRLSALAQAAQGNISFAQEQAKTAIDAKFAQDEINLRTARQNILDNYDSFNSSEKKRADATLLRLDRQDSFVAEQKDIQHQVQTEALKYAGMATVNQLDEMSKAKSAIEVATIARKYGLRTLEEQKLQSEISKNERTINNQGDTIDSLAQQLVDGTLAPAELSKRTSGAGANYNAILTQASKISVAKYGKPFNIAQADRDYKFANNIQTQNTLNYLGSLVGGVGQTGNLDELVNLSNGINRTKFPALNKVEAWSKLQTGDPAIAAYYATITEVADQVAKILQGGGTGNGTSDAKLTQALGLFQTGFSKEQINGVVSALRPLLANRAKAIIGNNPYLSDYADKFGISKSSEILLSPDGKSQVKLSDLTSVQIDEAKKAGWK